MACAVRREAATTPVRVRDVRRQPAVAHHLCVLIPKRGDPITAYSLAAEPADLNPAVERYIVRQKAFNKLGELMAYAAKAAMND